MFGAPQFGRGVGRLSDGLGVIGFSTAVSLLVSVSPIAIVTIFSLIALHLVIGWKLARSTSNFGVQSEGARLDAGALVDAK
jgi:hypothetical protein